MKTDISPEVLSQFIELDRETGRLFWKARVPEDFCATKNMTAAQRCAGWNSRFSGKQAFTAKDKYGYHVGAVKGVLMKAHRVVWALLHNQFPKSGIDHIDGNPSNNAPSNLRSADQSVNAKNACIRVDNQSGCPGVVWDSERGKWMVRVKSDKRDKYIGRFSSLSDAVEARKAAEPLYGYHDNHGRKAA